MRHVPGFDPGCGPYNWGATAPTNRVRDRGAAAPAGALGWRHGMAGVRLLKTKAKKRRWIPDLVGNDRLGKKRE